MTLDGMSVEAWLARHDHGTAGDAAHDGPPAARRPRVARLVGALTLLVGAAIGAAAAAPALAHRSACPPAGEGATYCYLQHNVLRALVTFLLVTFAVVAVRRIVAGLPAFVRRVRAEGLWPTPPPAASHDDPLLWAANRGHVR